MIIYRIDAAPELVSGNTVVENMLPNDDASFAAFSRACEAGKPVLFITRKGESVIAFHGTPEEAGPGATYRTLFDRAVLLDDMKAWSQEGHHGTEKPKRHFLIRLGVRAVLQGSCVISVVASDIKEANELLDRELDNSKTRSTLVHRAMTRGGEPADVETAVQDYRRGRIAQPGEARFAIVVDDDEVIDKDEDS
jgi:hypothetical protein